LYTPPVTFWEFFYLEAWKSTLLVTNACEIFTLEERERLK
jgi:hypothetical protein